MRKNIDLSVIIINWNTKQLLLDCVASVYRTIHEAKFEVFVVDNGSTDGSVEAVSKAYPAVRLIANTKNHGFAKANNMALKKMNGKYAVLLNSDTIVKDSAFDRMFDFMERHPQAGMCGPQLLNGDGSKQNSIGVFPTLLTEFTSRSLTRIFFPCAYREAFGSKDIQLTEPAIVDFIMGACMMARKQALDHVGTLDEDYFFFYEEIDWCFRMKKTRWDVYHIPDVEIYHFGGQSTKNISLKARAESWRSRYLFFIKNMKLTGPAVAGLYLTGFSVATMIFLGYSVLNTLVLFSLRRLRQRWLMFGYLFAWHMRGFPLSMCLPRSA